jgi:hypothetical protein
MEGLGFRVSGFGFKDKWRGWGLGFRGFQKVGKRKSRKRGPMTKLVIGQCLVGIGSRVQPEVTAVPL